VDRAARGAERRAVLGSIAFGESVDDGRVDRSR
jgi:hypothetical protein